MMLGRFSLDAFRVLYNKIMDRGLGDDASSESLLRPLRFAV